MDRLSKHTLSANQQKYLTNIPDTENAFNNIHNTDYPSTDLSVTERPQTRVRGQRHTARPAGSVSEPQPFTLTHTLCLSLLGGDGLLSDKVTVVSFYLPSQVDNHLHGGKKEKKKPVISSLFALVRKAREGGREREELAAMFSWLCGDPWQHTVSDVMRM